MAAPEDETFGTIKKTSLAETKKSFIDSFAVLLQERKILARVNKASALQD